MYVGRMDAMEDRNPRTRLLELAGSKGVSLAALSGLLGRNTTYLQQFVRKGSPRRLEERDRHQLATFFGVSESELGAPEFHDEQATAAQGPRRTAAPWIDVPRLPLGASAGPGAFPAEEAPVGQLRFSRRWLSQQGFEPAVLTVIAVEGDSMEPTLHDGDEILVDRTPRPLRAGIHVVRIDGVLLVKRLEPAAAGQVRVISDNAAYGRSEYPLAEVEILGRVVWKGGRI
jgi:phage repressor protein C with HTH and peptisase S24 domain